MPLNKYLLFNVYSNVSTNFLVGQIPSDGHLANFGNNS